MKILVPVPVLGILVYLGCGLVFQSLVYGEASWSSVGLWAHIVGWPVFLAIWSWIYILGLAVVVAVGVFAYAFALEPLAKLYRRWMNDRIARRNIADFQRRGEELPPVLKARARAMGIPY